MPSTIHGVETDVVNREPMVGGSYPHGFADILILQSQGFCHHQWIDIRHRLIDADLDRILDRLNLLQRQSPADLHHDFNKHGSSSRAGANPLDAGDLIYFEASRFGDWLCRELRALICGVAEDADARTLGLIVARLKRACLLNQDADIDKARALAREILNDWDAVIAFVRNPHLPPPNNDAERALRHAVISRRISHGTRTDEGSRGYAAALSVIETCRKRKAKPWDFITRLLAAARRGAELPALPACA